MMLAILLPSLIHLTFAQSPQVPTLAELKTLKQELINAYDTIALGESLVFKPLAGSVLRLIFHDCGGPPEGNTPGIISICDGCVELNDFADHQNLEIKAIDPLDDIYLGANAWNQKMTRSDFWAFAATVAILHTRNQANDNDKMPDIPYFFGRTDCTSSPDVDAQVTQVKEFPAGVFGYSETRAWLGTNFGFNDMEIVAILGAHTIGRNHPSDSGFTGPWVAPWGTFDNGYYQKIVTGNWLQKTAAGNGLKEWGESLGAFFTMLNVDISLFKDLDNHSPDGSVGCGADIKTCPANPIAAQIVQSFANNNQLWLDTFVPTYIKMITAGYDINNDFVTVFDDEIESGTRRPTPNPTPPPNDRPTTAFHALVSIESAAGTGKCIDVDVNNLDNNGAKVQIWDCHQEVQQTFYFEPVPNTNNVVIKSGFTGDDNCLDAADAQHASGQNGAIVQMWDCHFEDQQQFRVEGNTIKSSNGKCLEVNFWERNNNGGQIQLWDCNGESQQTWNIKAVPRQIASAAGTGKCIDVDVLNINNNGAKVQVWDCKNVVQQTFYFEPVANTNNVVIKSAFTGDDNCLDVDDPQHTSGQNGAKVQMWDCNFEDQQQWTVDGNTIKSSNGKCLEVDFWKQNDNGGLIQLWDCNGEAQQTWNINTVTATSGSVSAVGTDSFTNNDKRYNPIIDQHHQRRPQPVDDKYYINISEQTLIIICCLLVILLIFNVIIVYYFNGKNNRSKYVKIKYVDSETEFDTEIVS